MTDIATTASPARSIVFIDARVQDAATLLQGLKPGTEVVFLQAGQDGLAQMAAALGERGDVGAVHVLTHGSAGQMWLGNAVLDEAATLFAPAVALKVDPDAPAADDPYADPKYQVPDDLVW